MINPDQGGSRFENADGFAAKLTCGEGNVFEDVYHIATLDEGWDLFAKHQLQVLFGVLTI